MRIAYKIVIPTIAIVATIVASVAFTTTRSLERALFEEEYLSVAESVRAHAASILSEADIVDPSTPDARTRFALFERENQHASVARITVWSTDHRVIYSDLGSIIGMKTQDVAEIDRAFLEGKPFFIIREKDERMPRQSNAGQFLDIFVPITRGDTHAVVEVHSVINAILRPIRDVTRSVEYTLIGGGLLMFLMLTLILNYFVLRPVRMLAEAADRIAGGDYATPVAVHTGDEMELFSRTFDTMRIKVSEFVGTLERAVKERTVELEEARAELAASISSLPLGFGLFALDGKMLQSNRNLSRLLDAPAIAHASDIEHLFGDNFSLNAYLCSCRDGCDTSDIKEILVEGKFLRCFVIPVTRLTDTTAILGVAVLVEDITESKLLERAKDEFFAVASHELRTPLTAIRGNSELLEGMEPEERSTPEALGMVADIAEASARLIKIVNDFLDVSRMEQGGAIFKQESFDIVDVLRSTMNELSALARGRKIALNEDGVWPETLLVTADRDRTKQVAINLIANGLKFTRKGSVSVSLEWEGDFAVVRVRDTGPGIAEKEQPLLFRKFQQAQKDMFARDISQSTGLGLYISKLAVEKMGGTIALEHSEVGKGCTFRFTIPLAR